MPRDIVEHRFEALRRIVAVETRHDLSFFVEKEEGRSELHLEYACELLLGHDATIEPRHFAVAPHVHRERDEVLARFLHDAALVEIGHHELLAVGAAILTEIHQQPPAVARCLRDVLAQIEKSIRKPRWNIDCVRRSLLSSHRSKERERNDEDGQPMAHGSPWHRRRHCAKPSGTGSQTIANGDLKLSSVILLDLLDALVGAKERMFRHVRGILARRGMLAHGLRERADVMWAGAAAHAEIANPHVERLLSELRDLKTITGERIECHREGPRAFGEVPVPVA